MALTADRNTPRYEGDIYELPAAAAKTFFGGALAALDAAGNITPGATALGLVALGRVEGFVDNAAGLAGAVNVRVRRGTFRWKNSAAGDAITAAEIGDICYIVDDETVAKTDGGGTRSRAGIIVAVDAQGIWVNTSENVLNTPAGALLAANNFSDVGSKPTARGNLGVAEKMSAPGFVIGAEAGNVINVAIQLKNAAGGDLAVRGAVEAYLSDDANGDSIAATAPSGGVAIGTDGLLQPLIAGKRFTLVSEADGDIDINITEVGADTWYLIVVLPDGTLAASGAITFV